MHSAVAAAVYHYIVLHTTYSILMVHGASDYSVQHHFQGSRQNMIRLQLLLGHGLLVGDLYLTRTCTLRKPSSHEDVIR